MTVEGYFIFPAYYHKFDFGYKYSKKYSYSQNERR